MTDLSRRQFMSHVAAATVTAPGLRFQQSATAAPAPKKPRSIIVLWMAGGPSHLDLWTTKTGSANQGPFNAIKTSAKGIVISEAMPKMAEQMKHMVRIETLDSREGDQNRGSIRMLTGFPPSTVGMNRPHLGAVVSHHCGSSDSPLPFLSVGTTALRIGASFLGAARAPFLVQNPGTMPENVGPPELGDRSQTAARTNARKEVLGILEDNFRAAVAPHLTKEEERKAYSDASQAHAELVNQALDLSLKASDRMFKFDNDDNKLLAEYGNNGFGRGCLLARKLVEAGASAVQVDLGGWDMRGDIASGIRRLATGVLDPAFAALIKDLNQRGLYKDTLVVWMGPFGRTPRINQGARRSPWSSGWSLVLGGAGLKRGVSHGETDGDGLTIVKDPVSVHQLYATIYTALGIDLKDPAVDLHDELGRRVALAGDNVNVEPIKELLV